jgi:hypothetical protein
LYEEILGINNIIFEHEINNYLKANIVRQWLRDVNPRKAPSIKEEVDKIINVGFIYHVPFSKWVSNLVLVDTKQGNLHVCMDFMDLNKSSPKDNFPMPFIDHIIDECAGSAIFPFMDGFLGYNQIQIKLGDQNKMKFICPWGTFSYQKMPFDLKNIVEIFQRAMSFTFHDLKHIVKAYLDDLTN